MAYHQPTQDRMIAKLAHAMDVGVDLPVVAGEAKQQAVNYVPAGPGRASAVCQCCGKRSRPAQVDKDGEPDLWRMARGWSTAPFPANCKHDDGSFGSTFTCPSCNSQLRKGATLRLRAYILTAAALFVASAVQADDKALHLTASAGLGLAIRSVTDSKAAAFWTTVAVGAAKEAADSSEPGNRFDGRDMVANVAGAALATLGPRPDRVGVMGYTLHTRKTKHLRDETPGLMLSWDAPALPWDRGSVDVAIYRNSQGFPGLYAGLSKEWRITPRLFAGLGGGMTYGYRDYTEVVTSAASNGIRRGCIPGVVCVYEVPGKPKWQPAALASVRYQFDRGFSITGTYMPAGTIAKLTGRDGRYLKDSDALSLWISYRRAL